MADERLIDIITKVTRIDKDDRGTNGTVTVKATINLNGNTYEEHGTAVYPLEKGIIGAIEMAEDKAVDRAKKLAGIKDE